MSNNNPALFIEIDSINYNFVAGVYDENKNFKVVEKIVTDCKGFNKTKFTNIDEAIETIKKNVELIEQKLNFIFKEVTIIIDSINCSCINISGFKKLNGSQILKENISYILNSLKLSVTESESTKSILHIFNSQSILDGKCLDNLPIGLFGDFYNHELTFFLVGNNDLKNIKYIFNKNNLEVKNFFLGPFSEGTLLIKQNKVESFFNIKINNDNSSLSFFDKSSFRYSENFSFGSDIIFKDIEKICSIKNEVIKDFLSSNFISKNNHSDDSDLLEKKYFSNKNYRKIKKNLILDIAQARIEEIIDIIIYDNINLNFIKKNDFKIYVTIQDKLISDNFGELFKSYFSIKNNDTSLIDNFNKEDLILNTANLLTYGWRKEALPIIQTKKSLITRVFKSIFG